MLMQDGVRPKTHPTMLRTMLSVEHVLIHRKIQAYISAGECDHLSSCF